MIDLEHADDATLLAAFQAEFEVLARRVDSIRLQLTPMEAWVLISQIQLAFRHPQNTGPSRQIAEPIARRLAAIVAPSGALRVVAERGWDSQYDEG